MKNLKQLKEENRLLESKLEAFRKLSIKTNEEIDAEINQAERELKGMLVDDNFNLKQCKHKTISDGVCVDCELVMSDGDN